MGSLSESESDSEEEEEDEAISAATTGAGIPFFEDVTLFGVDKCADCDEVIDDLSWEADEMEDLDLEDWGTGIWEDGGVSISTSIAAALVLCIGACGPPVPYSGMDLELEAFFLDFLSGVEICGFVVVFLGLSELISALFFATGAGVSVA